MNDDFIYKALPPVRRNFAQSLYNRISTQVPTTVRPKTFQRLRGLRWFQAAALVLGLLLVAWSQVQLWIRYVQIGDLWLIEFSLTRPATDIQTGEEIPVPARIPTTINNDLVYRYPVIHHPMPGWIPEGFSATEIPGPGYAHEESIGMWSNDAQETIRLFVVPRTGGARPYAPPGMYKEVRIHSQPAILIFGRLAPTLPENPQAQRKWDKTLGLQLVWSLGAGAYEIYTLETLGPYVTEQDLIRMAESMKTTAP